MPDDVVTRIGLHPWRNPNGVAAVERIASVGDWLAEAVRESTPAILAEKAPVDNQYDTYLKLGRFWMAVGGIDEYSNIRLNGG